jgi:hypothetical protein
MARIGARSVLAAAVAIGDVNADGKPDLVAAGDMTGPNCPCKGGVSVLLGRGNGSFRAARGYRVGEGADSVALGDLNGDERLDLAIASVQGSDVWVLINRGDGRFGAGARYPTREPYDIAIADLNGDGKPELATANTQLYANSVSVFVNKGDGSFQPRVDYRTGRQPVSVVIGDLNGDGKPDLATASLTDTVSVLANRGDGTFPPRVEYRAGSGPRAIAIGDANGDHKPDLVTANYSTSLTAAFPDGVSVLVNRGDASFLPKRDYRAKGAAGFSAVAVADLNGDGRQDVAIGDDVESPVYHRFPVTVLLNGGDGTFRRRMDYRTGPTANGGGVRSVAIGDLNHDRRVDLVVGKLGWVDVLINRTHR